MADWKPWLHAAVVVVLTWLALLAIGDNTTERREPRGFTETELAALGITPIAIYEISPDQPPRRVGP